MIINSPAKIENLQNTQDVFIGKIQDVKEHGVSG